MTARPRLLLLGPLPIAGEVVGGTKVSFAAFVAFLRESGRFEVDVLDTSRRLAEARGPLRLWRNALRTLALVFGTLARAGRADVVLLFGSPGLLVGAGPWIARAARLRGRRLCVRPFGGRIAEVLDDLPPARRRRMVRDVLGGPLVLLQTRAARERLRELPGARPWPTTRDLRVAGARRDGPARRFLFLGQLRPEKGWARALAAVEAADADVSLTVAGPLVPGADVGVFDAARRSRWIGPVAPDVVPALLAEHDTLLFPSTYAGEGLPGAVIEALQCGLPVVACDFGSLGELVEDDDSGLLVDPGDDAGLRRAVERLAGDAATYARLSRGARCRGDAFRSSVWSARIESELLALTQNAGRPLSAPVSREVPS